jgi:hypothetical protein
MDSPAIRGAAARSRSASVLPTMTTSGSTRTDEDAARLVVTSAINFIDAAAVNEFIRTVETEGLETIRQRALYSDWVDGRRHRPYQDTSSDDANFFIAVAGELLAEVSDLADDWQRIIDRVSQFEEEVGIAGQPR